MDLNFSIIVPVYNRPGEIDELLGSLAIQTFKEFEIVIVEDGSEQPCDKIIDKYRNQLNISYFFKAHEMPSIARNFGMKKAKGNYFLFFDSDCLIPSGYMELVNNELTENYVDAYGGPDRAHASFTKVQKAINYAMTSFITTGGIRGGQKIDKFYPRSFNMGLSKQVFETIGGFPITLMHPGEDMVLSIEIILRGFKTRLIEGAFVYHKRRTSLKKFFQQVFKFGKVRFIMSLIYPSTFKIFYLFPSVFLIGLTLLVLLSLINYLFLVPVGIFVLTVFIDSLRLNKSIEVALLSVVSSFYQLCGYGSGLLLSVWQKYILRKDEYELKTKGFYEKNVDSSN